jgi:hypothetical protein
MTYVLYNVRSTIDISYYESLGGARKAMRAENRKKGWSRVHRVTVGEPDVVADFEYCEKQINYKPDFEYSIGPYALAEVNHYNAEVVKDVMVKNLISGKPVMIKSNTPLCCDPSSNVYWSM